MKKIIAAVLVVTLCLCLGAWTSDDAFAAYEKMNEAMNETTGMQLEVTGVMDTTVDGRTTSLYVDADIFMVVKSETDFDLSMEMSTKTAGGSVSTSAYYSGGYMYQELLGQKVKYALDTESAMQQAAMLDTNLSRSMVLSSSINANDPNGTRINIKLNPDVFDEMLGDMMSAMGMSGLDTSAMDYRELSYSFLVDDDYNMKEMDMVMEVSQVYEGKGYVSVYNLNCRVVSTNVQSVAQPTDLDSYVEIDLAALAAGSVEPAA